ncbi:MAG: hypothetical protein QOC60_910, partial [Frankiaceae bacterium]|nr:hypothetical protein [Frankiaceae bacterium]
MIMRRSLLRPFAVLLAAIVMLFGQPLGNAGLQAATPAQPVTHGLKGEYFKMSAPGARDFAQAGGVTLDPQINFPDLVPTFQAQTGQVNNTTARWTGTIAVPATDAYTFYAVGDNGFRLFIDGVAVIDHWAGDWDNEQTSAPVTLAAGVQHDFRLEMFQDNGGANMFLRWSSAAIAKQLVPQSAFTAPAYTPASGLKGEYYRSSSNTAHDFSVLGATTLDPNIDFSDLVPTFQSATGQGDHTPARWTGQIEVPTTGAYTFYAIGDNGFRLFIDGAPVIDHWVGDWDKEQTSAPITLAAGERHIFKLEMFQDVGGANMFLRWSSAGLTKQIVPASALTTPPGFVVYPVDLALGADGRQLTADFEQPVTNLGDLAAHLQVLVDTTPFPITSIALKPGDDSVVVVTLAEAV